MQSKRTKTKWKSYAELKHQIRLINSRLVRSASQTQIFQNFFLKSFFLELIDVKCDTNHDEMSTFRFNQMIKMKSGSVLTVKSIKGSPHFRH